MPPGTFGYDPRYRSENSRHDAARAQALLDTYGYVDRDGDGWRERPDGSPLVLEMATQSSQIERQFDENWQKSLQAVGVRVRFNTAQWPENLKSARAGRLQMWSLGSTATTPDGQQALEAMYGPSAGDANLARFRLPAFDDDLPAHARAARRSGARGALRRGEQAGRSRTCRTRSTSIGSTTTSASPGSSGYRQPLFRNDLWHYVDVDAELRERLRALTPAGLVPMACGGGRARMA